MSSRFNTDDFPNFFWAVMAGIGYMVTLIGMIMLIIYLVTKIFP